MNKTMYMLQQEVELEGFVPGTPEYDRVFLSRRVNRCLEMQNVKSCSDCKAFWDCTLAKQFLVEKKYGGKSNDRDPSST